MAAAAFVSWFSAEFRAAQSTLGCTTPTTSGRRMYFQWVKQAYIISLVDVCSQGERRGLRVGGGVILSVVVDRLSCNIRTEEDSHNPWLTDC